MKAGLRRYNEMITEQVLLLIKSNGNSKEVEEATALELPMLQKEIWYSFYHCFYRYVNCPLGTVMGMIRSFANLGAEGGGNAAELAVGISKPYIIRHWVWYFYNCIDSLQHAYYQN